MAGWYTVGAPFHEQVRRLVPGGRLTPRDQQVLLALAREGSMGVVKIAQEFFGGNHVYARRRLRQLREWQMVGCEADGRWTLLARGRQVVEALAELEAYGG